MQEDDDDLEEIYESHPMMLMIKYKRTDLLGHPLCRALVRYKWTTVKNVNYKTNSNNIFFITVWPICFLFQRYLLLCFYRTLYFLHVVQHKTSWPIRIIENVKQPKVIFNPRLKEYAHMYVIISFLSTTVHELILNGTLNMTVYGKCDWVMNNLMIRKESWQTTVSVIIMVVSASRLFIEILELFQVTFKFLKLQLE